MILLSSLTASVTLGDVSYLPSLCTTQITYINWLGFFFFLRIAVATSSSYSKVSYMLESRMESNVTNVLDLGAGGVAAIMLASLFTVEGTTILADSGNWESRTSG